MALAVLLYSAMLSTSPPISVGASSVGASISSPPWMSSFWNRVWLPESSRRWNATMGRSAPPTSFQLVIFPA